MAALFLLLTVGVTSLCASAQAQEAYGKLEETFRKGVDLSLEKLSEHAAIQNHFLFFKSVAKSNVEEETGVHGENPCNHLKNIQTPHSEAGVQTIDHRVAVEKSMQPKRACNSIFSPSADMALVSNDGDKTAGFDVVFIYHRFYLKATRCPKGTEDPAGCSFRNDVPMIDCAICYKTFQGDIEAEPKPYLNCLRKPSVTPEVQASRMEQCNRLAYSSGGTNLLASTGTK